MCFEADTEGHDELEIDAILDGHGLVKKQRGGVGAKTDAADTHAEAREAVIEAIQKLDSLYVALDAMQFGKRKRLPDWDRVLNVQRYTLEEPLERVHSIRYELGTWFERLKDDHFLANRRILELDAKREAPEEILARYFVQYHGEAERNGRIVQRVRGLFAETATQIDIAKHAPRSRRGRYIKQVTKSDLRHDTTRGSVLHPSSQLRDLPKAPCACRWMA